MRTMILVATALSLAACSSAVKVVSMTVTVVVAVDAVAQTSKQGFVFLFDREDGTPLFPIEYRDYPKVDVWVPLPEIGDAVRGHCDDTGVSFASISRKVTIVSDVAAHIVAFSQIEEHSQVAASLTISCSEFFNPVFQSRQT